MVFWLCWNSKIVSVSCEVGVYPFLLSLRIFWIANWLKSGCKMQYREEAEGGACYWNACGQRHQKVFLMVSQVTKWIGSDVAKKPSEGAVRKHPVIPCSWIKSQQMKDNEIQEKAEKFRCWKIICSEPNPAFQNTLTESESTSVHNNISQGLHLCYKGQAQNLCWNGLESSVSGQIITVTIICANSVCKNCVGKFKELLNLFKYFGCYIQTHKYRRRVIWKYFRLQCVTASNTWIYITRAQSRSLLVN